MQIEIIRGASSLDAVLIVNGNGEIPYSLETAKKDAEKLVELLLHNILR